MRNNTQSGPGEGVIIDKALNLDFSIAPEKKEFRK